MVWVWIEFLGVVLLIIPLVAMTIFTVRRVLYTEKVFYAKVHELRNAVVARSVQREVIYQQSSDTQKMRMDTLAARKKQGVGTLIAVIASLIVGLINPYCWLATVYFLGRWAVNNWRDAELDIEQVRNRR